MYNILATLNNVREVRSLQAPGTDLPQAAVGRRQVFLCMLSSCVKITWNV
jgi:hypothetical protein